MADIAMVVADEEFEKKLKRGAPGAVAVAGEEASKGAGNFGAVIKVWGSLVKTYVAEPKTPVALAAFDGFFSA